MNRYPIKIAPSKWAFTRALAELQHAAQRTDMSLAVRGPAGTIYNLVVSMCTLQVSMEATGEMGNEWDFTGLVMHQSENCPIPCGTQVSGHLTTLSIERDVNGERDTGWIQCHPFPENLDWCSVPAYTVRERSVQMA